MGPGPLVLPPDGDTQVVCQVKLNKPAAQEILLIDSSPTAALPADVIFHPMVVPSGALDINSLRILLKNDSSRETSIPVGTVIGCVYHIDSVVTIPPKETASSDFDESMINFGDSPISEQWKNRLCKKLAQKSNVFSMHEWEPASTCRYRRCEKAFTRTAAGRDHNRVAKPLCIPNSCSQKEEGAIRMCIDYRLLNSRTIPDQYTTPCIEDALNALTGTQWFSVLDLRSGYYQIAV